MAKTRKPPFFILDPDDAIYFYKLAIGYNPNELVCRKKIDTIAKKHGILISFKKFGKCRTFDSSKDEIIIYGLEGIGGNKQFFTHLRNAFAHCYISITEGRCLLHDWNAYESGKKCDYAAKRITMNGDVDYDSFKNMMREFFDPSSKISKKQKTKKQKKTKKQNEPNKQNETT